MPTFRAGVGWAIPDWLSPARLLTLTDPQWETVVLGAGVMTQILKRSAERVGLVVIADGTDAAPVRVTACPLNPTFGFNVSGGQNPFVATLADWFSVVNGPWYAIHTGGTTLQVCDIARLR